MLKSIKYWFLGDNILKLTEARKFVSVYTPAHRCALSLLFTSASLMPGKAKCLHLYFLDNSYMWAFFPQV